MAMQIRVLLGVSLIAVATCSEATAQSGYDARAGGGIVVGYDSRACDASIEGAIRFNSGQAQMQVCAPGSGNSCPVIGDVCSDGSVYAGLSPDGNVPMYASAADAPSSYPWNNGSEDWFDTPVDDCTGDPGSQSGCWEGQQNTEVLASLSGTGSPYFAAQYCSSLMLHTRSDWYLPSRHELEVLFDNRAAIGGFNLSGVWPEGYYWASSESSSSWAWDKSFDTGDPNFSLGKDEARSVRCVRKTSTPPDHFSWDNWGE